MERARQSEGSVAKHKCFGGDYVAAAARGRDSAPIRHRRAKDMDAFWIKILFLFMLGAFALGPNEYGAKVHHGAHIITSIDLDII